MSVKLQLALDVPNLEKVMKICEDVKEYVDIFEAGTLLCLSEGVQTLKRLREKFPNHEILADIRIIKAGKMLSDLVYKNGANIITVISDCDEETLKAVCEKAGEYKRKVQIEINRGLSDEQMKIWKKYGIKDIILHRYSELKSGNESFNMGEYLKTVCKLGKNGFKTGITGGITEKEIPLFKGLSVSSFIIGREILKANNPKKVAELLKNQILNNFRQ